jgi:ubiquinol-cytochrome c reductase iron-sulfur subunit
MSAADPRPSGRRPQSGYDMPDSSPPASHTVSGGTRRDFLYIATATVGAVGAAASLIPLIDQMNPDAATLAAGGPVEFDVSKLSPGQQAVVRWRNRPIFVTRRTDRVLKSLQSPGVIGRLSDPQSDEMQQPDYAKNWHRSIQPEYGVLVGICTHLGCIPKFFPQANATQPTANWPGGYFCPCHGSKYDLAGRVYSGVPAPYNLPVPPYHFISDTTVRIGENPKDSHFDFASIRQI